MTNDEHKRLTECYRLALAKGDVARFRDMFRRGRIVRYRIDDDEGFSDGVRPDPATGLREILIGDFQLRTQDNGHYGVWGRIEGQTNWAPVDGPWRQGDGPFDNRPGKSVGAP